MTISAIIKQKITSLITADEHEPFLTLAERLARHNIGVLVVLDVAGGLLGIVSERDLVRAIATHKSAALAYTARDVMTTKVIVCTPQQMEVQVISTMLEKHIRHMPVVDNGRVVGLVSLGDAVKQRMRKLGHGTHAASDGGTGSQPIGNFSRHLGARVRAV